MIIKFIYKDKKMIIDNEKEAIMNEAKMVK